MILNYNEYITESNQNNQFFKTYEETENWLDRMNIVFYTINKDLTVDVDSDVHISFNKLTKIPIQFNNISGYFSCEHNYLKTLKGCPKKSTMIYCTDNPLENINDLDSKLLIKSIRIDINWIHIIEQDVWDKYFIEWIDKDPNIVKYLKDKISDKIKKEYKQYFDASNFDLI